MLSSFILKIIINPLDRDGYIHWRVLCILLVARASCLNGQIVSTFEGCLFWGWRVGYWLCVAALCIGKRVPLGFHVGLSASVQIPFSSFFLSRASLSKGKWNL